MSEKTFARRLMLPLAMLLACTAVMGLECQLEPLPDTRRGFAGDPCRPDGTCEPCHNLDDAGFCTSQQLFCSYAENPPRCRPQCSLAEDQCAQCGPAARCTPLGLADGGFSDQLGTCLPAGAEGEACGSAACAGCLLCAQEGNGAATCRRQCDPAIDAGPPGFAFTGDHPYCRYPDLPETGAVILQNCCQFGQTCTPVSQGSSNFNVCFGPLPGQPGSTCKPAPGVSSGAGTCNSNALCTAGDSARSIPNICEAAGGPNQPCRANTTCDPNLICIADAKFGPRPLCRERCVGDVNQCGSSCDPRFDCVPAFDNMQMRIGDVCVPGVGEGQSCASDLCELCLVCGSIDNRPDAGSTCRRTCNPAVDAGSAGNPVYAQPGACNQPDPDGGPRILANCCPTGQICLSFTSGTGAACFDP
jgi:hypothetical protein